jgi:molybdopterin synthase sulfur carrier subunit
MKVSVRYFASLREALGAGETLEVSMGTSLAQLRQMLIDRGGPHARALALSRPVRTALNHRMADETATVQADCEVGFFPPVTGG